MPQFTLSVARATAETKLKDHVKKGAEIRDRDIQTDEDYDLAEADYNNWCDFARALLRSLFVEEKIEEEFSGVVGYQMNPTWDQRIEDFRTNAAHGVRKLESIIQRLPVFDESAPAPESMPRDLAKVFIVHGHDDAAKDSVARVITQLGLEPTILHEKPSKSRTIIEKLEDESNAGFAVVLLTPDDEGKERGAGKLAPRARQNVVLELGYFIGKIGRRNVCTLYKEEVELPSDYDGVIWVPYDDNGAWRLTLASEMKSAGLDVDLNKLA